MFWAGDLFYCGARAERLMFRVSEQGRVLILLMRLSAWKASGSDTAI